jgi:hypothetical protein
MNYRVIYQNRFENRSAPQLSLRLAEKIKWKLYHQNGGSVPHLFFHFYYFVIYIARQLPRFLKAKPLCSVLKFQNRLQDTLKRKL